MGTLPESFGLFASGVLSWRLLLLGENKKVRLKVCLCPEVYIRMGAVFFFFLLVVSYRAEIVQWCQFYLPALGSEVGLSHFLKYFLLTLLFIAYPENRINGVSCFSSVTKVTCLCKSHPKLKMPVVFSRQICNLVDCWSFLRSLLIHEVRVLLNWDDY